MCANKSRANNNRGSERGREGGSWQVHVEQERERERDKPALERTESITLNLHNLFINWLPSKAISTTWQAKEAYPPNAQRPATVAHWDRAHAPRGTFSRLSAQVEIKLCGSQTSWKRAEGIVWKSAKCRPKVDNAEWPLKSAPCSVPGAPLSVRQLQLHLCLSWSKLRILHWHKAYNVCSANREFRIDAWRQQLGCLIVCFRMSVYVFSRLGKHLRFPDLSWVQLYIFWRK